MSGSIFRRITEGFYPSYRWRTSSPLINIWKKNNEMVSSKKSYSVTTCMNKTFERYASTSKMKEVNLSIGEKNKIYKNYEERLRDDITPLNLIKSAPAITHYFNVWDMTKFAVKYILSYRFFFIYMARTTFQAVRPLMAFCVFGELMKLVLATMTSGVFAFFFSFVLAFEVLYFFLQCYISYTFLSMFFDVMF